MLSGAKFWSENLYFEQESDSRWHSTTLLLLSQPMDIRIRTQGGVAHFAPSDPRNDPLLFPPRFWMGGDRSIELSPASFRALSSPTRERAGRRVNKYSNVQCSRARAFAFE